ncbi:unnamed protein product [Fusarium graminearum]|nr:unnamed protein product [Fusarium graminearum]
MISRNFLTGTVVLLAACLANASPCRPSLIVSSSTVVASVIETATKSETATSTASVDVPQSTTDPAESESTTETGTTVNVETTSGASSIGNGDRAGNLLGYYPSNDYSLAIAAEATLIEDSGLSPIDCDIVAGNGSGYQKLQCQFGNKGNADFWTCGSNFVLVSPGVDFTNRCPRATTSYKLDYIEVVYIS